MKKSKTTSSDLLGPLPATSPADTAALRKARRLALDPEHARRLQKAMRQPSYEELASRPILDGEPFRL